MSRQGVEKYRPVWQATGRVFGKLSENNGMKHSYHILFEIILIFILAILFFRYQQIKKDRDALQASKKRLDFELRLRSDSMTELQGAQHYLTELSDSLFDKTDINYFSRRGLKNPEKTLLNSLYQQQQLIPAEAVLGGQMKIWYAVLLSRNWALAYFEDGHKAGNMLVKYTVTDGDIQWELIESSMQ